MKHSPTELSAAELQRQREEIRRGLTRVTTAGAIIVLVVLGLGAFSVVAALRAKRQAAREKTATLQSQERLADSKLAEARALRLSGRTGRRFEALAAIREAAAIRPTRKLRDEAIANLALTDLGAPVWFIPHPPDALVPSQPHWCSPKFGPDLEFVAWALTNGAIRITRSPSSVAEPGKVDRDQQELAILQGPSDTLNGFTLSPDGNYIGASYPKETWVWDRRSGLAVLKMPGIVTNRSIEGPIAFSADSQMVAVGLDDSATIYQLAGGRLLKRVSLDRPVSALAFNPREPWLAFCDGKSVRLLDWVAERVLAKEFSTGNTIRHLAWSPNGRLLAAAPAAPYNSVAWVWDVTTPHRNMLETPAGPPVYVAFSPNSAMLAVVGEQGSTAIWDALEVNLFVTTFGGKGCAFNHDNTRVGFWNYDGVGAWPLATPGNVYCSLTGLMDQELDAAIDFSPDGRYMITVSREVGGVWLWDLASRQIISTQSAPRCQWVRFTPDAAAVLIAGQEGVFSLGVATNSLDGGLRLEAAECFESPKRLVTPESTCLLPDGRRLLAATDGGKLVLSDVTTRKACSELRAYRDRDVAKMAVSHDGKRVATTSLARDGIFVWELENGKLLRQLESAATRLFFSPDGRWLVSGTPSHFEFWDANDFELVRKLPREQPYENPAEMAFSLTNNLIACRRAKFTVDLLQANTLELLATIELPSALYGRKVHFSSNGEYLGIHDKGSVHLWRFPALRRELAKMNLDWSQSAEIGQFSAGSDVSFLLSPLILALGAVALVIACAVFVLHRQRKLIAAYMHVDEQIERRTSQLETAHTEIVHSQKMKALGTLAAGIAHDFNNLLSVIRMSNQLTREEARGHAAIQENAAEIEQAVNQGKRVVRSMLGYSRKESDEAGPFVCAELIEDTVALLTKQFLNGIALTLELDRNLPLIPLSRNRLEQVLLNLIVNASEAMKGTGHLQIVARPGTSADGIAVLRPRVAARYAELLVADSGPGIDPEILPRIFEPFFTTKNRDATRGTGLGLSTVYTMAQQDGLGITVKSVPSKGAEFRIILPLD